MPFSEGNFEYDECVVRTIANTTAKIPAGRHHTVSDDLKVRVIVGGLEVDMPGTEFDRLRSQGKVRD